MAWMSEQTDYGYFLCGMALFVLSIFCFRAQTLPSRRSPQLPLAPLGAFALFLALHQWSLLVLATLRSGPAALSPLPGLFLFLAIPAALLSLRVMVRLSARHEPRERRLALGLGAVLTLLPLCPGVWPALTASVPPGLIQPPFQVGTALALQLLHALLALLAALLVFGYSGAATRRMLLGTGFLLAVILILAGGWALTCFLGRVAHGQIRTESYTRASTIVAFLQDNLFDVDQTALAISSSEAAAAALASGRRADLERASLELERYRKTLGMSACFLLDRSGTVVASSEAEHRDRMVGRSYAFRPYFQGALAGRQSHYFAVGKLSGERCYFSGAPVPGAGGRIIGVAVGARGVEEVEAEFRKYPEVSLVSPDGIIFISSQKRLLFRSLWPVPDPLRAELAASGQFGALSFAPLLSREPVNSLVWLEGRKLYAKRMPIGAQGWSVLFFEPTALVSDYRIFGIAVTCAVSLLALCCFVMLISHRESMRGAERLRCAKEEWERTFDAVPDLVAIMGRDQRVRRVNRAMAHRLGLEPRDAAGRTCYELLGCGAEPSSRCPQLAMLGSGSAVSGEVYNERLRGRFILSVSPIPSPAGETESSVLLMHDVTEQKRLAEEVNRIRNLESVGILAGGLAHDFNNVLNVICGNVTFAIMLAGGDAGASEALRDAEQACQRALELGRRLQLLAKGGLPVREPVLLAELAHSSAQAVFKESPVRWRISAPDDLYPVEADARQIRQVFESLLLNAREAVAAGGTVAVEIRNAEVGAQSGLPVKAGRFVCASIRDEGRGIAPEDLKRIFDPYFSTKDSYHEKGLGLGLPICHAVVKRHQGHISVDSEIGRGTTVAVYLPASA